MPPPAPVSEWHAAAPVSKWHNDTYPAISPTRPELSMKNSVVAITGAGSGIGREVAHAFAEAGAAELHILGRTQKTLEETKELVESKYPEVKVAIHIADVSDEAAINKAAKATGPWNVLVANAGYCAAPTSIADAELTEWWKSYETNVKGSFILTRAFLPTKQADSILISFSAGGAVVPAANVPGISSYTTSKLAVLRFFEYVAAENPDLRVVNVHPGVIWTDMLAKVVGSGLDLSSVAMDQVALSAHFTVWAASSEAKFLNGRFIWCNWDVDQLKELQPRLAADPSFLTAGQIGFPFD